MSRVRRSLLAARPSLSSAAAAARVARAQLTVYAAASLTDVFPKIDSSAKYSFGGSNTLAAQITQGAPADVFASANMTLPTQLYAKGLCSKPVVFTRNTLVIVVPKSNPGEHPQHLRPGEAGRQARHRRLGRAGRQLHAADPEEHEPHDAVLANVVSQETDVREVLAKVALGEADAGFVYSTDAKTVPGKVTRDQGAGVGAAEGAVRRSASSRRARNKADAQAFINTRAAQGRPGEAARRTASCRASSRRRRSSACGGRCSRRVRRGGADRARVPACCRSSRSSCTRRRGSCSTSSRTRSSRDAFVVSMKTSVIAQVLILLFGTPTAYLLATRRFPGTRSRSRSSSCRSCCRRPSPGSGCSSRSGAFGLLGSSLDALGISLPFTQSAVTVAVAYVASPLYIRQAIAAFEATDPNLAAASRTLGAGPARTFFRVVLPLARGGLIAGLALSFARGLGEFGATIMFAGQPAAGHADAAARDLRGVRPELQRDARDERRARPHQRRPAPRPSESDSHGSARPRRASRSLFGLSTSS